MALTNGRTIVQTAGEPQLLTNGRLVSGRIVIGALLTNTERVAIGDNRVSAAYGYEQGIMLYPGQEVELTGSTTEEVYIDAVTDDEGATWWGESV